MQCILVDRAVALKLAIFTPESVLAAPARSKQIGQLCTFPSSPTTSRDTDLRLRRTSSQTREPNGLPYPRNVHDGTARIGLLLGSTRSLEIRVCNAPSVNRPLMRYFLLVLDALSNSQKQKGRIDCSDPRVDLKVVDTRSNRWDWVVRKNLIMVVGALVP